MAPTATQGPPGRPAEGPRGFQKAPNPEAPKRPPRNDGFLPSVLRGPFRLFGSRARGPSHPDAARRAPSRTM
eukprot:3596507-Pyramimonas_sp.AAC.1